MMGMLQQQQITRLKAMNSHLKQVVQVLEDRVVGTSEEDEVLEEGKKFPLSDAVKNLKGLLKGKKKDNEK